MFLKVQNLISAIKIGILKKKSKVEKRKRNYSQIKWQCEKKKILEPADRFSFLTDQNSMERLKYCAQELSLGKIPKYQ